MHVADGILSTEISVGAYVVSVAAVYALGRRIEPEEVTRMGLLSAASFVVSLIHFPLAGTSVHLGLFGLIGILLGRRAFPVIFATLLFQTLLFQHGGLLSLGVNAVNMGAGGLLAWGIWLLPGVPPGAKAFAAGFVGVMTPALLMAFEFSLSGYGRGFYYLMAVYLVVAAVEAALTMAAVAYFRRVKPGILALSQA
jgi:cobalt/nickel transport system permease protein